MKTYVKPVIALESLALSASASTGCAITSNSAPGQCPVEIPGAGGLTVFPDERVCAAYFPGYEDSLCYHVPTADINVFES